MSCRDLEEIIRLVVDDLIADSKDEQCETSSDIKTTTTDSPCEDSQVTIEPIVDEERVSMNLYPNDGGWLARIPAAEGVKNCRGRGATDWQGQMTWSEFGELPTRTLFDIEELSPDAVAGADYSGIHSGAENYIAESSLGSSVSGIFNRIASIVEGSLVYTGLPSPEVSVIHGGYNNVISQSDDGVHMASSVIGGRANHVSNSSTSAIVNGEDNLIESSTSSAIVGSTQSVIDGHTNAVVMSGSNLMSYNDNSTVMGRYNLVGDIPDVTQIEQGPVTFGIGSGQEDNRDDVFRVYENGNVFIRGQICVKGSIISSQQRVGPYEPLDGVTFQLADMAWWVRTGPGMFAPVRATNNVDDAVHTYPIGVVVDIESDGSVWIQPIGVSEVNESFEEFIPDSWHLLSPRHRRQDTSNRPLIIDFQPISSDIIQA